MIKTSHSLGSSVSVQPLITSGAAKEMMIETSVLDGMAETYQLPAVGLTSSQSLDFLNSGFSCQRPLARDPGTYLSRNFATLGPLT